MKITGAILVQMSNRVHRGVSQIFGTLTMFAKAHQFVGKFRGLVFISRVHERISDTLQLLAAFPKTHLPFHIAAKRLKAQKKVGLAALKDPTMLFSDAARTRKTVRNNGTNAFQGASGY
jgi:hypothetical protein